MATTSSRRAESLQRPPKQDQHLQHHHYPRRHPQQHAVNGHSTNTHGGTGNPNESSSHALAVASAAHAGLSANDVAAKHGQIIATPIRTRNSQQIHPQHSPARMKRPLDPIANNFEPPKPKRTRIAVEILARPASHDQPISPPHKSIIVKPQRPPTGHDRQPAAVASATRKPPFSPSQPATTATAAEPGPKKYREKAFNGIRHELDKLQPSAADASSTERPGRKLRSQKATRFKSELSAYFPDYDEVIGNDPKEQHILNLDTPIILIDTNPDPDPNPNPNPSANPLLPPTPPLLLPISTPDQALESAQLPRPTVRTYSDHLFTDLHDSQRIDFSFLEARYTGKEVADPLIDSYFEPSHKRAERLEKSIRNTEKGRAQHEKDQIIRLLNELQGHDWLRTMGVSGVTESRKKTFEPARDHFISGCQAILEKFRAWNQEEKRRKLQKERALAEEAEEGEEKGADSDYAGEESSDGDEEMAEAETEGDDAHDGDSDSDGDPVDYGDVDPSARQLHAEALARARYAASGSKRSRGEPPPKSPEAHVAKEFTSFFKKKHQRDAALSKGRRRGRTILAWGHPVPDPVEYDFDLPEEYRDTETLKAHERRKRRDRRQHRH
ncbi:something about silencing, SAS, complex subunit 4-domain-containing protein [Durotheca rogersii]|uniref:something about silencing, SAS, complex subunit 4-domain-containing protein n=1 Tax=Durotheca rogersii TaxID=419775 RepID=UPI00221FDF70|nr:something about silencing, SAS, complex subunit 4-domain-containing protein [Durotheca rogersii]KAI5864826.1 something about silencing, SAS, complex subunit 4-domain-containing protein [Durotheca rogersii]